MGLSRLVARALLLVACFPSVALACSPVSDVDRDAFYRAIALPGRAASAVSILTAIVWLVMNRGATNSRGAILIALAVLNPGWWMWGIGDCGVSAFVIGGLFAVSSLVTLGKGVWSRHLLSKARNGPPGV